MTASFSLQGLVAPSLEARPAPDDPVSGFGQPHWGRHPLGSSPLPPELRCVSLPPTRTPKSPPPAPAPAITSQTVPSSCARPALPHTRLTPPCRGAHLASPPPCSRPARLRERPAVASPPPARGPGQVLPARWARPPCSAPPRAAPPRAHRACAEPGHTPARSSPERTLPASAPGPRYSARRHGAHRGGGRGPLRSLALPAAAHAALPPGEPAFRAFRGPTPAPDPALAPMAPPMASCPRPAGPASPPSALPVSPASQTS